MTAGYNKAEFAAFDPINQQPVGFDMAFAAVLQRAFQRVIHFRGRQLLRFNQHSYDGLELFKILMSFYQPFDILFELSIAPYGPHHSNPKLIE